MSNLFVEVWLGSLYVLSVELVAVPIVRKAKVGLAQKIGKRVFATTLSLREPFGMQQGVTVEHIVLIHFWPISLDLIEILYLQS